MGIDKDYTRELIKKLDNLTSKSFLKIQILNIKEMLLELINLSETIINLALVIVTFMLLTFNSLECIIIYMCLSIIIHLIKKYILQEIKRVFSLYEEAIDIAFKEEI